MTTAPRSERPRRRRAFRPDLLDFGGPEVVGVTSAGRTDGVVGIDRRTGLRVPPDDPGGPVVAGGPPPGARGGAGGPRARRPPRGGGTPGARGSGPSERRA